MDIKQKCQQRQKHTRTPAIQTMEAILSWQRVKWVPAYGHHISIIEMMMRTIWGHEKKSRKWRWTRKKKEISKNYSETSLWNTVCRRRIRKMQATIMSGVIHAYELSVKQMWMSLTYTYKLILTWFAVVQMSLNSNVDDGMEIMPKQLNGCSWTYTHTHTHK